jgi:hypothetical protein
MTLVANSLFEITAPNGLVIGFAACESDADRKVAEHMAKIIHDEIEVGRMQAPIPESDLVKWWDRHHPNYKIVRVG